MNANTMTGVGMVCSSLLLNLLLWLAGASPYWHVLLLLFGGMGLLLILFEFAYIKGELDELNESR